MRYIDTLEASGEINRTLEFLPNNEDLSERIAHDQALTRPELAVLVSYSKVILKSALLNSNLDNDEYCNKYVLKAFPNTLTSSFEKETINHRLKKEIVSTQIANDFVNKLGITSLHRLCETTGACVEEVVKAYLVSSSVFELDSFLEYLVSTDNKLPTKMQYNLMANITRRTRRGVRWFLKNRRSGINPGDEIKAFLLPMQVMRKDMAKLVSDNENERFDVRADNLRNIGVDEKWITLLAMPENLFSGLGVVEAARLSSSNVESATQAFYALIEVLRLEWFATQVSELNVDNYWQAFARESFIDDLEAQLRKLSIRLLGIAKNSSVEVAVDEWHQVHESLITRWHQMMHKVESAQHSDYSMFTVAIRELIDLVQATEQWHRK
jgi:glutamate dehydrogenase